jgi:hypothetical protein
MCSESKERLNLSKNIICMKHDMLLLLELSAFMCTPFANNLIAKCNPFAKNPRKVLFLRPNKVSKVIATLLGMANMEKNYCKGWDSFAIVHLNIIEHSSITIISQNTMLT